MKFFYQSFLLLFACGIVFVWKKTPFADLTFFILGFFLILLFGIPFLIKKFQSKKDSLPHKSQSQFRETLLIFAVITAVLLIIFQTGLFNSSLFFLLYFVTFGIVFVFEPATVFIFVLGLVAILLPDIITNAVTEHVIKTSSIVLVSPLAFFFGREYVKESEMERKNK